MIRDRNALYRERADGSIENVYDLKILNKDRVPHAFAIAADGLPGLEVDYGDGPVTVGPGDVRSIAVKLRLPRGELRGGTDVHFTVRTLDEQALEARGRARFLAPTH